MQKIVKTIIFLIFLFILSVFFIGLNRDTNYNTANQINKEIPDFKVSYLDKENFFTKNDLRKNNFTLINFWASWCAPCRIEHPLLIRLSEEKNMKIVGVNFKDKKEQAKKDAVQFAAVLSKEIDEGSVEIETDGKKIIIRVQEKGSFVSGSARLKDEYIPVIAKIRDLLLTIKGAISIEGHTDNIPADGKIFTSNWDLSAARALAVANEIFADVRIKQKKFEIVGRANTRPLVPNNTAANRATNRRVEIIVERGKDNERIDRIKVKEATDTRSQILNSEEIF